MHEHAVRDAGRGVRHVNLRHHRPGQPVVGRVVDDANDLKTVVLHVERRLLQARQVHELPQRRPPLEACPNEPIVHERHREGSADITLRQHAARGQADADSVGIPGIDLMDDDGVGARRSAGDGDRRPQVAERMGARVETHGCDTGQRSDPREQGIEKGDSP
jgi:hypothetical protein